MTKESLPHPGEQPNLFNDGGEEVSPSLSAEELALYLHRTAAVTVPLALKQKLLNGLSQQYLQIFAKGDLGLLELPSVSVVGTRAPSAEGKARATQIGRVLVEQNFVVMSGLAKGIDTAAHETALRLKGKTIAVLGTPIHKIYPAENKKLAEEIVQQGLLLSPSLPHEEKGRFLFPRRNRLMARLSIATVIVEAGPTSGVIHQAAECLRQKKKLILLKSLAENQELPWVAGFLKSGALVANSPQHLIELLRA